MYVNVNCHGKTEKVNLAWHIKKGKNCHWQKKGKIAMAKTG